MIDFMNIKTGERVSLTNPHHIGAYINSSDLGVNSNKGQDFGWRLAPDIVVRVDDMANDPELLDKLSTRLGISMDELTIIHLIQHISYLDDQAERMKEVRKEREPEFKNAYEQEIAALRKGEDWDEPAGTTELVEEGKAGPTIDLAKLAEARATAVEKPKKTAPKKVKAAPKAKPTE